MSHRVTIDLPDAVMARLQRMAQRSHRDIEVVLAESISGWVASIPNDADLDDSAYWNGATVTELAERQGVRPAQSLDEFEATFWPEDESVDDFVRTVAEWRAEDVVARL
jgi:hypothetical protein